MYVMYAITEDERSFFTLETAVFMLGEPFIEIPTTYLGLPQQDFIITEPTKLRLFFFVKIEYYFWRNTLKGKIKSKIAEFNV